MFGAARNLAGGRIVDAESDCRARRNLRRQCGQADVAFEQAGFVQATRGTKGGYTLARTAGEIYLNEVIKILDADEIDKHCEGYKGILEVCIHKGDCGIRPLIVGLHQIVNQALSHITLAQLVGEERKVTETFQQIQRLEKRAANQILER